MAGPDGRGVGDPSSQRIYDEAMARGIEPRAKGPMPIVGWNADDDEGAMAPGGGGASEPSRVARRRIAWWSHLRRAPAAPRGGGAPTGPKSPADAWKWEGVPPGGKLLGPVEPGRQRWCLYYDAVGPKAKQLPAAWPPDDAAGRT